MQISYHKRSISDERARPGNEAKASKASNSKMFNT